MSIRTATLPTLTVFKFLRLWCWMAAAVSWNGEIGTAASPVAVAHELLIKCADGPNSSAARAADIAVGATVVRRFENLGWYLVRLPTKLGESEAETLYLRQPGIVSVEVNRRSRTAYLPPPPAPTDPDSDLAQSRVARLASDPPATIKPNDPMYSLQWSLKVIGMENAWSVTTGSTNVVVAVFDTGVNYRHPDLAANMWRNPGESGLDAQGRDKATNGVDDDNDGYIDDVHGIDAIAGTGDPMDQGFTNPPGTPAPYYHGTACAGIIGAVGNNSMGTAGINWNVRIMALAIDYGDYSLPAPEGGISVSASLSAFDYVLMMKRRGVNVRVASLSWTSDTVSEAGTDALRALAREGILAVFAAANDGRNSDQTWWRWGMIDSPNIISVTGVNRNGEQVYDYGRTTTDLGAPTIGITTLWSGTNYFTDFNGTSAACPHVSGAAALLLATKPDLTVDELKSALYGSVDRLGSLVGKTRTNGRLNVKRALESLTNSVSSAIVIYAAPGGVRTDPLAPIEVTFNRPMDRASVEAAFSIQPPLVGTFEWSADSRSFSYRHSTPFGITNHLVKIAGSASSQAGDTLDGNYDRTAQGTPSDDYIWNFRFATPNDDLANAQLIAGAAGSVAGNNTPGTSEVGQPGLKQIEFPLTAAVWYRWIAPSNGWFSFDLRSTVSVDTTVGVFLGTNYQRFEEVASNNNYGNVKQSRVSFIAEDGRTYSIAVGGDYTDSPTAGDGNFTLRWYPTPPTGITSMVPPDGATGQIITLNGTNFTGATRVTIHGISAPFRFTNANFLDVRLAVTVPEGASTGPVVIETPRGTAVSASEFAVYPRPNLAIETGAAGEVIVSWPELPSGYLVETSDGSANPIKWTRRSLPTLDGSEPGRVRAVDTSPGPVRLYRLRHP